MRLTPFAEQDWDIKSMTAVVLFVIMMILLVWSVILGPVMLLIAACSGLLLVLYLFAVGITADKAQLKQNESMENKHFVKK